jgi:undecaprenol kinase
VAFGYAVAGLATAWRTQRNVRIHAGCAVLAVIAGALVRLPPLGWGVLLLAIALVLVAELLNTALEAVVDLLSPDDHPLAKAAKDIAAAAVLVAAAGAVAAGIALILWVVSAH